MIPEEYVTFETAKLLKEAGFPQDKEMAETIPDFVDFPTQAQAMRWLRGCNLNVEISIYKGKIWTMWLIKLKDDGLYNMEDVIETYENRPTYEAAAEAGIQAACNYLINKQKEHESSN